MSLSKCRNTIDSLQDNIIIPNWQFEINKHNKSKNFVDIFQGLWIETHSESFYRNDIDVAFQTINQMYLL